MGEHFRQKRDDGASLVEFALLMPLLVLLLLGIVEFGWGLAQQVDVRHKARETLRQAIVDAPVDEIQAKACGDDMVKPSDVQQILLTTGVDTGTAATVTVTVSVRQLTGFFGAFWGADPTMSSTVEGRVEQPSTTFSNNQDLAPCP